MQPWASTSESPNAVTAELDACRHLVLQSVGDCIPYADLSLAEFRNLVHWALGVGSEMPGAKSLQASSHTLCCAFVKIQDLVENVLEKKTGEKIGPLKSLDIRLHLLRKLALITDAVWQQDAQGPCQKRACLIEIVDACQDRIEMVDSSGEVVARNKAAAENLSIEHRHTRTQQRWLSFWSARDERNAAEAFKEAQAGKTASFEGSCRLTSEKPEYFSVAIIPTSNCATGSVIAMSRDITSLMEGRRQLKIIGERAVYENTLRDKFISTLSHDLRNPLTAARSSAQIICRYPNNHLQHIRLAERLIRTLDRAESMMADLLDVNRICAGEPIPLTIEPMCLKSVVEESLKDLALSVGDRFVVVDKTSPCGSGSSFSFYSSPSGVRRVIDNLASNAVKYGDPEGIITLTLDATEDILEVNVHNVGTPIAHQDQALLFSDYYRTADAEGSGKKGWGLGLTLVRGIVEGLGGSVSVRSAPVAGTTFLVRVPKNKFLRAMTTSQHNGTRASGTKSIATTENLGTESHIAWPSYLSHLLASTGHSVIATTVYGRIEFMNANAETLCGALSQDAAGRPLCDVVTLLDAQGKIATFGSITQGTKASKAVNSFENFTLCQKHGRLPVDGCVSPIKDARGRILGFVVAFEDASLRVKDSKQKHILSWITESNPEMILILSKDFMVTYLNPTAKAVLGSCASSQPSKNLVTWLASQQRAFFESVVMMTLRKTGRWRGLITFTNAHSEEKLLLWCDFFALVDKDSNTVLNYALNARLARKNEHNLYHELAQQKRVHRVLEAAKIGFWEADDKLRCTFASAASKQLFGHGAQDVIDDFRALFVYMSAAERRHIESALHKAIVGRERVDVSCEIYPPHQASFLIRLQGAAVQAKGKKRKWVITGICRQVARRLDKSVSLNKRHDDVPVAAHNLHALLDSMPIYFCILRGNPLRFVYANALYKKNWNGRDITGRHLEEMYPDVRRSGYFDLLTDIVRSGRPRFVKGMWMNAHGVERCFDCSYAPRCAKDTAPDGVVVVSNEVTRYKRARQLADASQRLSQSLRNLASHELRTPLTTLRLQLQMAERAMKKDITAALKKAHFERFVAQANRSVARLSATVNNILQCFGPLDEDEPTAFDLSCIIDDIVQQSRNDPANCHLKIRSYSDAKLYGVWSRQYVKIIVCALVGNAIKHGRGSDVCVFGAKMGNNARVTVEDFGPGIDGANHEVIFELCGRAHGGQRAEGLGLGLYICRRLVSHLGGHIYLDSALGQGSRFIVDLPMVRGSLANTKGKVSCLPPPS